MWLEIVVIAFLLVSILFELGQGNSGHEEVDTNSTTGFSLSSSSRWLSEVMNRHDHDHDPHPHPHPHPPRPPGCRRRPWICREGYHPPPTRMLCCTNQCVDVSFDADNCGFCGIRCMFGWQCCNGFCANTNVSPFNCGKCGNRCPLGVPCAFGMCGYADRPTPPSHSHSHSHSHHKPANPPQGDQPPAISS